MPTKEKPHNLKTLRGWSIALIIASVVLWLLCNTATTFYMSPPTLMDILWGVACWLPVPALGCAIAAWALAEKNRPKMARILAIFAAGLLVSPFCFLLYIILFISL